MSTKTYTDIAPSDAFVIHGGVKFDRWIIGEAADSGTEYVVHLSEPMFMAKFWDGDDNDPGAPNTASAYSVSIDDTVFYDIIWLDEPPEDSDVIVSLLRLANDAITRFTMKD